jgi:hypothetical protein
MERGRATVPGSKTAVHSNSSEDSMADYGTSPWKPDACRAPRVTLSGQYESALAFARVLHANQFRKSNGAPYLSHLIEVSGLVLEYGGDETQSIAALLHDAIEDQSESSGGADFLRRSIESRFGAEVLRLVEICTDCETWPKPSWAVRKQRHLARLGRASRYDCLVPACDKLHNLRCINSEFRAGLDPFARLQAGANDQLRHFSAIGALFDSKCVPLAMDLHYELAQLRCQVAERHCWGERGAAGVPAFTMS